MPDKVSIHNCLLFAEEFLKLLQMEPIRGNPLLEDLGAEQMYIHKNAMQPASVEFLGRELNAIEVGYVIETMMGCFNTHDIHSPCAAFSVAHIIWHIVNLEDEC